MTVEHPKSRDENEDDDDGNGDEEDGGHDLDLSNLNRDTSDDDANFLRFVSTSRGESESEIYIWLDPYLIRRMESKIVLMIPPKGDTLLPARIATLTLKGGLEIEVLDPLLDVGSRIADALRYLREGD